MADLTPHYDALLFAYGASQDRRLGIPGENLDGVYSARAFVGWYNGLPEYAHLEPKLNTDTAIIIGNGNVALDVVRVLLSHVDRLRATDITEQALATLGMSQVKHVHVVGRRGPMQASFTIKELRELVTLPNVTFGAVPPELLPPGDAVGLPRPQKRIAELLTKHSEHTVSEPKPKSWELKSLLSPVLFESSTLQSQRLSSVSFHPQIYRPMGNPFSSSAKVIPMPDAQVVKMPTALVFRSIGYKSTPLQGLEAVGVPFDSRTGTIPNDGLGRVLARPVESSGPEQGAASSGEFAPGMYCTGWVKRGPTGVIASTMLDAFASAESIAMDWQARLPFLVGEGDKRGWDGLSQEQKGGTRRVSWQDWLKIDKAEKEAGMRKGKEREKFSSVEEMMAVLE